MCFSATASFATAAFTGAVGFAALIRVNERRDFGIAAIPLFFATQQTIEGLVWLSLSEADNTAAGPLTVLFLLFAKVFWPLFAPLAAWTAEEEPSRRRLMAAGVLAGILAAIYFLWSVLAFPQSAQATAGHITYLGGPEVPTAVGLAYFASTALTPIASSHLAMKVFGALILTSSVLTYFLFWDAFSSVWCFFAAGSSVVLLYHFERKRRARLATAETAEG